MPTSPSPAASDAFVTIGQAAAEYQCSTRTIRRRIATGDLPAFRLGSRSIRIRRADLDRLLRPVPTVANV